MSQSETNKYDQTNIDTMQMVYGRGYLSAGGDTEVARIFSGMDLSNKHVLDLGCGLGGASLAMVKKLHADRVTGFDIDSGLLKEAKGLMIEEKFHTQVELVHGEPGDLLFPNSQFDVVYMTAVSCHIENLQPFFEEIRRVLKPKGVLVGSEWYRIENNQAFLDWDNLLRDRGLNFYFKSCDEFSRALHSAGFSSPTYLDRTHAFARFSREGIERVEGELQDSIVGKLGERGYEGFLQWSKIRYHALSNGGIGQYHFHATC